MNSLRALWEAWGCLTYRAAARISAWLLASTGHLQSVVAHRSVATGEVSFLGSDIDLLAVLHPASSGGPRLAQLYGRLIQIRSLMPLLCHVEVYPPHGLRDFAHQDTVWADMERRSSLLLYGSSTEIPQLPLRREHALRRFLLWWEILFCPSLWKGPSLWRGSHAQLRKACLECWNFYALAMGISQSPWLRRDAMQHQLNELGMAPTGSLANPSQAIPFFFGLVEQLHRALRPPLDRLTEPLQFNALTAPHGTRRSFLVLPRGSGRCDVRLQPGQLLATPELLDLMVHYKNAFYDWIVPPEIRRLGVQPASLKAFQRDARYLCAAHFLLFPGFVEKRGLDPRIRLKLARYVLEHSAVDRPTPALATDLLDGWIRPLPCPQSYYRQAYDEAESERQQLANELERTCG